MSNISCNKKLCCDNTIKQKNLYVLTDGFTPPMVDLALGIRVFGSVSGRNHWVPGISDKSFLYPIGTYEISVRFRFDFGRFRVPI